MVDQVSSLLAEHSLNIQNMMSKGKNDIVYNIIDIDSSPKEDLFAKLKAIEGVVMVRSIEP